MKKTLLIVSLMLFAITVNAQLPKVAYIYAEAGPDAAQACEDIATDLFATGHFDIVDTYNASDNIGNQPSLAQIMTYDAVLIQGNSSFADAVALGDDMAAFAASGGGVILATYTLDDYGTLFNSKLLGEWQNSGEWHIVLNQPLEFLFTVCGEGVGTIYDTDHPVVAHANELEFSDYHAGAFPTDPLVTADAVRLLDSATGHPIAYASTTLPNRLDLGIFMRKPVGCSYDGIFNVSNFLADAFYYVIGEGLNVNNNSLANFTFSPNPIHNKLNLNSAEKIDNVAIYSVLGKRVFEKNNMAMTTAQLDLSNMIAGIYLMKVTVNGQVGTYKIIKN